MIAIISIGFIIFILYLINIIYYSNKLIFQLTNNISNKDIEIQSLKLSKYNKIKDLNEIIKFKDIEIQSITEITNTDIINLKNIIKSKDYEIMIIKDSINNIELLDLYETILNKEKEIKDLQETIYSFKNLNNIIENRDIIINKNNFEILNSTINIKNKEIEHLKNIIIIKDIEINSKNNNINYLNDIIIFKDNTYQDIYKTNLDLINQLNILKDIYNKKQEDLNYIINDNITEIAYLKETRATQRNIIIELKAIIETKDKKIKDLINEKTISCSICLDTIDINDKIKTRCNHIFHKNCLEKWKKNNCPNCRSIL